MRLTPPPPLPGDHHSSHMSSVMPDVLCVACHTNTLYIQHHAERVGVNVMGLAWFCEMLLGAEDLAVAGTSWLSPLMTEYVNISVLRCSVCVILFAQRFIAAHYKKAIFYFLVSVKNKQLLYLGEVVIRPAQMTRSVGKEA